jgi:hypothetical protein
VADSFIDIKQACQKLQEATEYDMRVRAQLEKAGLLDDGYNSTMRVVHESNAQLLETFVVAYGWPYPSKYGKKIHRAAWFIAIHAISRPHILRMALQLLKDALDKGETVATEYAKLFDRIALYEGGQQYYGTQFWPSTNGWYAYNLYEPEQVDERRKQLGLSTFLEGKKECGAGEGGIITQEEIERDDAHFNSFLREYGWRI